MITIADTLLPEHILLDLDAPTGPEALESLLANLRDDERVLDWDKFSKEVRKHPQCRVADDADFGISVPHARTDAVNAMVMSAARLKTPLTFRGCPKPIRYIFCLGVPKTIAAEYLRIAGALMRLLSDPEMEAALRETTSREAFIAALTKLEAKL